MLAKHLCLGFLIVAGEPDQYAATFISQLNPTDSFFFDFSKRKGKLDTFFLNRKRHIETSLNLSSLEKGFDSIQMRFYFGCSMGYAHLIILKNENRIWKAEVSKLQYALDLTTYEPLVTRTTFNATPSSGWPRLIRQLFELKALTLPDENDIPNEYIGHSTDGWV